MATKIQYPEVSFRLPRGRLIAGSLSVKKKTDYENKPLPEDKWHYWFAVAVPKNAPGVIEAVNGIIGHTWATYQTVAGAQGVLEKIAKGLHVEGFSWKLIDGDTHPKWSQRDYCRGCFVFMPMSYYDTLTVCDGANVAIDPAKFQLGDYIDLGISSSINGGVGGTAGVYINPVVTRWLETGPRIVAAGADIGSVMGAPVNAGWIAPQAGPMSGFPSTPSFTPPAPPMIPGQAGPAPLAPPPAPPPVPAPLAPPPAPPPVPAPQPETNEAWNMRHTGQPAPGFRWNPTTGAWDVAAVPMPPVPAPVAAQAAPVYGSGQYTVASGVPGGQMAIASPYSAQNPPPAPPVPGFAGGGAGGPPRY